MLRQAVNVRIAQDERFSYTHLVSKIVQSVHIVCRGVLIRMLRLCSEPDE